MTLQECYAALDGDFAGVSGRLPSEKFIQKYVLKFLDDGSYELLLRSMEEENWEEAFRAAHTIKGMCQNLDFTRLYESRGRNLIRKYRKSGSRDSCSWQGRGSCR